LINPIDDLLGEIEKFKSNIANSNRLMELLKTTTEKLENHQIQLTEEHEHLINKVEDSLSETNKILKQNDLKIKILLGMLFGTIIITIILLGLMIITFNLISS